MVVTSFSQLFTVVIDVRGVSTQVARLGCLGILGTVTMVAAMKQEITPRHGEGRPGGGTDGETDGGVQSAANWPAQAQWTCPRKTFSAALPKFIHSYI